MADAQERTEQATPKRRQDSRKKGQVARSVELSGAVTLLVVLITLRLTLGNGVLLLYLHASFATLHEHLLRGGQTPDGIAQETGRALLSGMIALAGMIGLPLLAGFATATIVGVAQVGILWTPHPLIPDFNRINPVQGLTRLFGPRGAVELVKAVLKLSLIGSIIWATLRNRLPELLLLSTLPTIHALGLLGQILYLLAIRVVAVFLVLAAADYAYQRWEYEKGLRMSKEEIKQEHKQQEGDPHLKSAIRQRQRAMAQKRMMEDVPKADVVITNPTHFAVAISYDNDHLGAPRVLAKGQDAIAARIREIARENDVPLVENPPLARALHKSVDIGKEIPPALYAAVAEVLAYVYRTNQSRRR